MRSPLLSSIFCGILATLALPPLSLFPLIIPAYSGLLLLLWRATTLRQAFGIGWGFGLGYFASGLYWFAHALLIEPEKFAWMIPFAVLGLPALLGIFFGLAGISFFAAMRRCTAWLSPFLFAAFWLIAELARGHLFTGFPWNLAAETWVVSLPMLQGLSVMGAYGYSAYTVLLAALPALCWIAPAHKNTALALCLAMILLPFSFGLWRLEQHPTRYTNTTLALVQPSIPQKLKWQPEQRVKTIEQHVALSKQAPKADVFIWSESAYPYVLQAESPPLKYIAGEILRDHLSHRERSAKAQPETGEGKNLPHPKAATHLSTSPGGRGKYVITGAVTYSPERITNSLAVIGSDAGIAALYDKVKLVPFGEFMPFRWLLPIDKITHGMRDFSAGIKGQVLSAPHLPSFLPLICYEVIFPEMAESHGKAQWLVNITNDGWFGVSSGPYQHFAMARMRAVEQGLPLVRVANNGISGVIDPLGRVVARLGLNETGVLQTELPSPLFP